MNYTHADIKLRLADVIPNDLRTTVPRLTRYRVLVRARGAVWHLAQEVCGVSLLTLEWTNDDYETVGDWIEDTLRQTPFVQYDRFIEMPEDEDWIWQPSVFVYGWVGRENDEYKDFVVWRFWVRDGWFELFCSNAAVERRIHRAHDEWNEVGVGQECQRVERSFDIPNAIELDKEITHD